MIVRSNPLKRYDRDHPLSTTFSSVPIGGVDFPAISVDFGDVTNPNGFAEKVLDAIEYACPFKYENETEQFMKVFEPFFRYFGDPPELIVGFNLHRKLYFSD